MSLTTIFGDRLEHTLQDVIVDNNMKQTDTVEVTIKSQRENRTNQKHLNTCGKSTF